MSRKIGPYKTAQFTPERVLQQKGLVGRATALELAEAASAHDNVNRGYLSEKELLKGADDLLQNSNPASSDRYRFSSRTLGRVQSAVLKPNTATDNRFTAQEIIDSAKGWDDGNGYLNRKELMAGALELQLRQTRAGLNSSDIASIRSWTGVQSKGPAPDAPTPSLVDASHYDLKTREAQSILSRLATGLDISELEDAADEVMDNREGTRKGDFSVSIEVDNEVISVALYADMLSEGTEYSFDATFEVQDGGHWQLVDSNAD